MIEILRHRAFRQLFLAQVVALVGTGLATVALALLAYDLAGDRAGAVLGTALAIKMAVYVLVSPVAGALVTPRHRKRVLVAFDIVRALLALALPFVTAIWQVYLLIALLQTASAGFTPLFQSVIPEILPDERDYTRALSLSRLAYDLESLLSPALAALLLMVISFHGLFAGTAVGFVLSALLVLGSTLPKPTAARTDDTPYARALRGMRIYLHTPRLRALLALNLVAAAGGAMVFVNTIVIVRSAMGGSDQHVAWALAAFGGGSMLAALLLPGLLDRQHDRRIMLCAGMVMMLGLAATAAVWLLDRWNWWVLAIAWIVLGVAYAGLVTPGGRLLRRSAGDADLPLLFAAQFSLVHAGWMVAYPLAGWLGEAAGFGAALVALCALAALGLVAAWRSWPALDPVVLAHRHDDLPADHPHLREHPADVDALRHAHPYSIDDLHPRWPA